MDANEINISMNMIKFDMQRFAKRIASGVDMFSHIISAGSGAATDANVKPA